MNVVDKSYRITSIDALRAVTLFGIMLVHSAVMFSFLNSNNVFPFISEIGYSSSSVVLTLLQYRCNTIFGILFGVSFYLVLKNSSYTSAKFVWRCCLLFFIGLINKLFYTNDALMWYGVWGGVLVLFRNSSNKNLLLYSIFFFALSCLIQQIGAGDYILGERNWSARYSDDTDISRILKYPMPSVILDYLYLVRNRPFDTLWKFLLGYYFAKAGYIDDIEKYARNTKLVLFFLLSYIVLSIVKYCTIWFITPIDKFYYLYGAMTYALLFLWFYYKSFPKLRFLESYGRLGLTNYSMQSVIGILLTVLVFIPLKIDLQYIILCGLFIFIIQLFFSVIWLEYFKYGPFEYIWRSLTNWSFKNPLK